MLCGTLMTRLPLTCLVSITHFVIDAKHVKALAREELAQALKMNQSTTASSFNRLVLTASVETGLASAAFKSLLNVPSFSPLKKFLP